MARCLGCAWSLPIWQLDPAIIQINLMQRFANLPSSMKPRNLDTKQRRRLKNEPSHALPCIGPAINQLLQRSSGGTSRCRQMDHHGPVKITNIANLPCHRHHMPRTPHGIRSCLAHQVLHELSDVMLALRVAPLLQQRLPHQAPAQNDPACSSHEKGQNGLQPAMVGTRILRMKRSTACNTIGGPHVRQK